MTEKCCINCKYAHYEGYVGLVCKAQPTIKDSFSMGKMKMFHSVGNKDIQKSCIENCLFEKSFQSKLKDYYSDLKENVKLIVGGSKKRYTELQMMLGCLLSAFVAIIVPPAVLVFIVFIIFVYKILIW